MISLCLTNHNRTQMLYESFEQVLNDDRISEIVISDDCSDPAIYQDIVWKFLGHSKVKVYRNEKNIDCYKNKKRAVELATNDWVILFDSDNILTTKYIDAIGIYENPKVLYQPCFARPHFDFRPFQGEAITKHNVKRFADNVKFQTMLNAMNYFVNRNEFLMVWDGHIDPVTSDSLFQNYNWLKAGNTIVVREGMEYDHRVHAGSHYQNNVKRTPMGFHNELLSKLKRLT